MFRDFGVNISKKESSLFRFFQIPLRRFLKIQKERKIEEQEPKSSETEANNKKVCQNAEACWKIKPKTNKN